MELDKPNAEHHHWCAGHKDSGDRWIDGHAWIHEGTLADCGGFEQSFGTAGGIAICPDHDHLPNNGDNRKVCGDCGGYIEEEGS